LAVRKSGLASKAAADIGDNRLSTRPPYGRSMNRRRRGRTIAVPAVLSAEFDERYRAARAVDPERAQRLLDLEVRRQGVVCAAPVRARRSRRIGHNRGAR
jgi:hypothetical protein